MNRPDLSGMTLYLSSMTLRDYFAAHAIGRVIGLTKRGGKTDYEHDLAMAAELAYIVADAMIKERDK